MTPATLTLTDFLLARIAEDEAVARAAESGPWASEIAGPPQGFEDYGDVASIVARTASPQISIQVADEIVVDDAAHIARHDPVRVLAECAAKREIVNSRATFETVAASTNDLGPKMTSAGAVAGLDVAIRYLASAYSDHPDYQSEWTSV